MRRNGGAWWTGSCRARSWMQRRWHSRARLRRCIRMRWPWRSGRWTRRWTSWVRARRCKAVSISTSWAMRRPMVRRASSSWRAWTRWSRTHEHSDAGRGRGRHVDAEPARSVERGYGGYAGWDRADIARVVGRSGGALCRFGGGGARFLCGLWFVGWR